MHIRSCAFFLLVGLLLLTGPMTQLALSAPFTSEQCTGLRQLRHELETRGVGTKVAKGAQWAAENLNAEQLSEIGAFLKLGEEIRFRCGKSTIGKKRQSALHVNIPLPVRNSRRLLKEKAEKTKQEASVTPQPVSNNEAMSPEEKSVLSAVTDEKKENAGSTAGKPASK
ncbi:MAG: hypothetical protein GY927_17365 [bacterium]|nr:hypothetical protein [bacterium]